MKRLIVQYTWIMGIAAGLFLLLLLSGCNQPPFTQGPIYDATEESNTHTEPTNSIGNMESIANALGCVFAPNKCNTADKQ